MARLADGPGGIVLILNNKDEVVGRVSPGVVVDPATGGPDVSSFLGSSAEEMVKAAQGIVAWNAQPQMAAFNGAHVSQVIHCFAVGYRRGQVVSNIGLSLSAAASGTAPAGAFVGIASLTTMLRGSANLASDAGWTTGSIRTFPLTSPVVIPADGLYYHLLLVNGTWSTAQPTYHRAAGILGDSSGRINGAGPRLFARAGTGQTALPADGAALAALTDPVAGEPLFTFST